MLKYLIKAMRPRQWTKNSFVFFALIFDKQLFHVDAFVKTLEGFLLKISAKKTKLFFVHWRGRMALIRYLSMRIFYLMQVQ